MASGPWAFSATTATRSFVICISHGEPSTIKVEPLQLRRRSLKIMPPATPKGRRTSLAVLVFRDKKSTVAGMHFSSSLLHA